MYDTIIIGGGASGMMAAIASSNITSNITQQNKPKDTKTKKVLIIEHNDELGKKLKITGGGRCNILNCEYDIRTLLNNYGTAKDYLYTPFSIFGVEQTIKFFNSLNIDIKVEDRKRAFPTSDSALDVYKALEKKLKQNKVRILLSHKAIRLNLNKNKSSVESLTVQDLKNKKQITLQAKKFILATGGLSHRETGSTGDGFKILSELGIKIQSPTAGLTPLRSDTKWLQRLSGKTLKDIRIDFYVDNVKRLTLKHKDILCTHFGLSGPSIINISNKVKDLLQEGPVSAAIDLMPSVDHKEMNANILNVLDKNKNKKFKNVLNQIYPDNILPSIIEEQGKIIFGKDLLGIDVHSISREDRHKLIHLLKNLKVNILSLMDESMSIVTNGGVSLNDINLNTMQLKQYNNLAVTGDLLDIDRPSGGYSLQLCWTTGYIAGNA